MERICMEKENITELTHEEKNKQERNNKEDNKTEKNFLLSPVTPLLRYYLSFCENFSPCHFQDQALSFLLLNHKRHRQYRQAPKPNTAMV